MAPPGLKRARSDAESRFPAGVRMLHHPTIRKSEKSPPKLRQRTSTRSTRAALGPRLAQRDELLERVLFALGEDLDAPSGRFFTQPVRPEALRLALRRRAEEDALNAPADEQLNLLETHARLLAAGLGGGNALQRF